ncbi:glycosyltransferase [Croceibacterium sp. TMG7-5b_MA50]|uniref:glycosyltransferase family 2 protein n=1 Tax=Croceibacterium sp. TMG7-5b_MA50 TaxID=3121290 RepID=UPI003221435E
MWTGSSGADKFVDVIALPADPDTAVTVSKRTLAIFIAGDLPVGQVWLAPGASTGLPSDIVDRVARRGASRPQPLRRPTTSLVVCTRDRPEELRRCLASLAGQSMPADEIIVVDNASKGPQTRRVAESAGVTYVREDRPGLDFARNSGVLASTGEIILYADDDTEIHPRWIENVVAAFDRPDVAAVTGLVLPATLITEAQWLFERDWSFGRGYDRIDYDRDFYRSTRRRGCPAWTVGAGANMAFRRSVFDQIGLFDERLDVGQAGCSGDSEYWYRILAAGLTCRYEPTAVVWHHHRLTIDGLKSQIFHYLRGHTAALMVQYERTGDIGNLYRAFFAMPRYYLGGYVKRLLRGVTPNTRFLGQQVSGAISGLVFYARTPRSARGEGRPPQEVMSGAARTARRAA